MAPMAVIALAAGSSSLPTVSSTLASTRAPSTGEMQHSLRESEGGGCEGVTMHMF